MQVNPISKQSVDLSALPREENTRQLKFQLPSAAELPAHQKPEKPKSSPLPPNRLNSLLTCLMKRPPHASYLQSLDNIEPEQSKWHATRLVAAALLKEVLHGNT